MHRLFLSSLALSSITMFEQPSGVRPQFEVASVRPNDSGTGVDRIRNVSGTFDVVNVPLKRLIAMAWGIPESREYLISGPEWIGERNFDVAARYPPATVPAEVVSHERTEAR